MPLLLRFPGKYPAIRLCHNLGGDACASMLGLGAEMKGTYKKISEGTMSLSL